MTRWTSWMSAAVCAIAAGSAGCHEKDSSGSGVKLAPAASSLAASPPPGKTIRFTIDAQSTSSIDMPAPKEHIKATTDAAAGALEIDPANVGRSRGEVKIDLSTLTTKTFADDAKNKSQTVHARCWLEVADCAEGKLGDDVKRANQYAVYAIRSIENPSAPDLAKVAPTKDGADELRTVRMTTRGDLLIHGHRVEGRAADVEVQLRYAAGAAPDNPRAITVRSRTPLHVVLAEHDVKPRDTLGKIAKGSFHVLGTKVADTADISLDLRGTR